MMSFDIKLPDGQIDITSPMEIIKAKDLVLKVDGKDIELSISQKNRLQTALKNHARELVSNEVIPGGFGGNPKAYFENSNLI